MPSDQSDNLFFELLDYLIQENLTEISNNVLAYIHDQSSVKYHLYSAEVKMLE
jgi:hypothetical protein